MREVDSSGSTAGYIPSSAIFLLSTVVASRWLKVVAGAGSVKSSAGTYTAWTDVMEPFFVEVIRSCICPISVAKVGWYPTADGMRPRSAETSEPAWVKRKILSMKKRISLGLCGSSLSRKDSARVNPERATEDRAPGGSFIWPKTMATWDFSRAS